MQVKRVLAVMCCLWCLAGSAAFADDNIQDVSEPVAAAAFPEEKPEAVPDIKTRTKAILEEFNDRTRSKTHHGVIIGHVYIPKGTPIILELQEPLSSKDSEEGKLFHLKSVDDVVVNNVVVIPAGTTCIGKVLNGRGNKGFGRGGKLELAIASIPTVNGVAVPLNGYIKQQGKKSATWFAPWWIAAFMKGKELHYEQGQLFRVTVRRHTDLQASPDNLAAVMGQKKPRQEGKSLYVDPMI